MVLLGEFVLGDKLDELITSLYWNNYNHLYLATFTGASGAATGFPGVPRWWFIISLPAVNIVVFSSLVGSSPMTFRLLKVLSLFLRVIREKTSAHWEYQYTMKLFFWQLLYIGDYQFDLINRMSKFSDFVTSWAKKEFKQQKDTGSTNKTKGKRTL